MSVTQNGQRTCYVYGAGGTRLKKIEGLTTSTACTASTLPATARVTVYFGPVELRNFGRTDESLILHPHGRFRLATNSNTSPKPDYFFTDALGSIRVVLDTTEHLLENNSYTPWGEKTPWLSATQTQPETKGWIGERYDEDAGLQYLNARYYDPKLGLFLQPDWFEVKQPGVGTNRYSYSFNDPINKLDPNGNAVPVVAIAISAAIAWAGSWDYANAPTSSGSDGDGGGSATYSRSNLDMASTMVGGAAVARGIFRAGTEVRRLVAESNPRVAAAASAALAIDSMGEPGGGFGAAGVRVVGAGRYVDDVASGLATPTGILGRGGRFGDLQSMGKIGDNIELHHIPQAARGFTSRADGGAIGMTAEHHSMTRTFGPLGRGTNAAQQSLSFRDTLARDLRDIRGIDRGYTPALRETLDYYRTNFPDLMRR